MADRKNRDTKLSMTLSQSEYYRQVTLTAVPVDVFLTSVTAYQAGASMTMPVVNPEQSEVGVLAFTDSPMNRGVFAVKELLGREQKDLLPAVLARIISFGAVVESLRGRPEFRRFFESEAGGSYMVSDALLEAFARAPFVPGTLDVGLDAVFRIAAAVLDREERDEAMNRAN